MIKYEKGEMISEGKTKQVFKVVGHPGLVIIRAKDDITAFDQAKYTKQFPGKGICSTTITCRVFELLKAAGIPVGYREQLSEREFLAEEGTMIPLEVIGRRCVAPESSCLKRTPQIDPKSIDPVIRLPRLSVEFDLKTTGGGFIDRFGDRVELGLNAERKEEDPLIEDPYSQEWQLLHSKKPAWEDGARLGSVQRDQVISDIALIDKMDDLTRRLFLVLEGMWKMLGYHILDIKVEYGFNARGELMLFDVIDADSWRLRDRKWEDFSKQSFRDGQDLDRVARKFWIVADKIQQFAIPDQTLVVWRGSDKDSWPLAPESYEDVPNLKIEMVTLSGHKQTGMCLDKLNDLQRDYPSGVILAAVGMSNGLGPVLAAHSVWPVIGMPATAKEFPEDVWSSLRTPSQTPMLVCLEKNAVNAARNLLALQNPVLYMKQQRAVEELDRCA
ncbi:TPA: hypothetical protein DD449_05270 [Candidatus Berkelbacteria bacterium]|uniref:phosphoribosylaminoimidazolesuccinocarboxamide synthase n=1 Tax=Berkelbacteria bacterium GW2011_GWE1_39_12 TaxID=1618337 RepID=A0A0G4B4Y4_9BACT|nr:MAG: hypothetical protein UT28_C0001G0672 [Berkelbacteria bacterium GW2011_GWE1_39_12]HBO61060.1 hypothetical protein [Candidatus Berkelbacteria bacterium]